jgi:hypothetical protein
VITLNPAETAVLAVLAQPHSWSGLIRSADEPPDRLETIVSRLDALGLLFRDSRRLVSLVLLKAELPPRRHWWDNYSTRFRKLQDLETGAASSM